MIKRLLAALGLLTCIMAGYVFIARPYQLHWGATAEEQSADMPGDELVAEPDFFATRAITIAGTPEDIWPWLIQMGYNRAGFYGYDILENLGSDRGLHSAKRILPQYQEFQVGDAVPISSVHEMKFYAIEPNEYLIWSGTDDEGSFLWALQPVDATHTRLISRIRWSYDWSQPQSLGLTLFTEFTDHLAVREILRGVKGRVEGSNESMARQNAEFALFVVAALVFLVSLVLLLFRPLNWPRWLAGLGAGVAWLVTWYAPVALWVGVVITLLAFFGLLRTHQMRAHLKRDAATDDSPDVPEVAPENTPRRSSDSV
ncbi:MAG: hypothetical protein GYB65_05145 [Chloroflexi bacterium]|nr:hypothetical protein [Chloroflexota bacterium]